jgi:hypothetical protein
MKQRLFRSTFTAVDTAQTGFAAAFLPPSAIYIEHAKPPPADPDGGRFHERNQKRRNQFILP